MSVYNFTDTATGKVYRIDGPPDLTEPQARIIWQQQLDAGALTGLRRGESIDAYTQALGGLSAAESQVAQADARIAGTVAGRLTGPFDLATQSSSTQTVLIADNLRSERSQALTGINQSLRSTPITDPITFGDYARQSPALRSVQGLAQPETTASLSQASRLVDQDYSKVSDDKGLGRYGLSVEQLERAGLVKPGTSARYLNQSANSTVDVLKSPSVWTGKDGVNSMEDLLASPAKQDRAQQDLMSSGLASVEQLGIPVDQLSPQGLAGVALNAAKNIDGTVAWAKNLLSPDAKLDYDILAKDAAFSVNFAKTKLNGAMKQEIPGFPAIDTVDRATLDAAAARITGNDKIPDVRYTNIPAVPLGQVLSLSLGANTQRFQSIVSEFNLVSKKTEQQRETTASFYADLRAYDNFIADLTGLEGELLSLKRLAEKAEPPNPGLVSRADAALSLIDSQIATIEAAKSALEQQIAARGA